MQLDRPYLGNVNDPSAVEWPRIWESGAELPEVKVELVITLRLFRVTGASGDLRWINRLD